MKQTILVVDDDLYSRKLLEVSLAAEGYAMRTAGNGEEALVSIADQAPDLILLDVMMPGMNGYELAALLKAKPLLAGIPVVMVTAWLDRDSRLAGLKAGAEEFLTRPIDRTELCLRVRNLLRLKSLADDQRRCQQKILELNVSLEARVQQRTAELVHSNKELESFSYSVSHDLRSPLISIDGFISLLGKDMASNDASVRAKNYLGRIRNSVVQMGSLIDALLQLAHVSRIQLDKVQVDLSTMAHTILDTFREREPDRALVLDIQPGLRVFGDPSLLRLVMENLLSNSWKFSSKRDESWISFCCQSDEGDPPIFAIQDNGAGFSMDYSSKLFNPFQRLHNAQEFNGTGIGLATVSRIVSRHGGKIWAESAPNQGATFYFTL